jgi:hypothetical protein
MNAVSELVRLVEELAAHWTEPALEILTSAGMRPVSVDLELEMWQVLKRVLRGELRWPRSFRSSTVVSMPMLMEQVLQKAAVFVYQKHAPWPVPYELAAAIRQFAADRRASVAERNLYAEIIRQPGMRAFKAPSRSDFVPRLRLSVAGR